MTNSDANRIAELEAASTIAVDTDKLYRNITSYIRALDRLDINGMLATYWPDSTDDHGNFKGTGPEFCRFVESMKIGLLSSHHMIGNVTSDIDGNRAQREAYFRGVFVFEDENGAANEVHSAGRFKDICEKRDGEWKILKRIVIWDWSARSEHAPTWEWLLPGCDTFGSPSFDDPIYRS